jgi:hypothetical protein
MIDEVSPLGQCTFLSKGCTFLLESVRRCDPFVKEPGLRELLEVW